MGGGRTSNPEKQPSSLDRAIAKISAQFQLDERGYIGEQGRAGEEDKRQIRSNDPREAFKELAGILTNEATWDEAVKVNFGGKSFLHNDGSRVTIRPESRSGSPVIEISSQDPRISSQKIHFEEAK